MNSLVCLLLFNLGVFQILVKQPTSPPPWAHRCSNILVYMRDWANRNEYNYYILRIALADLHWNFLFSQTFTELQSYVACGCARALVKKKQGKIVITFPLLSRMYIYHLNFTCALLEIYAVFETVQFLSIYFSSDSRYIKEINCEL